MVEIVKEWDGNECVTDRGNRVYVSRGRWQWIVIVDGVVDTPHDRKRDAVARVEILRAERQHAYEAAKETANRDAIIAAWNALEAVSPRRKTSWRASGAGMRQAAERRSLR